MNPQAAQLIKHLNLVKHPEGGYYRETYRAPLSVQSDLHRGPRSAFTSIHFLLADGQQSAWHRVASDESWFFHVGCDLEIYWLAPSARDLSQALNTETLGVKHGKFELTIPAGRWFAARPVEPEGFSLVSCVVGPGFSFEDFELADRSALLAEGLDQHPDWAFIESLLIGQAG